MSTLSFKPGLTAWNFNIQRRIQRLQETDRWSGWSRDYKVTQTSRAGELTGLPAFDLGLGLSVRPAVTTAAACRRRTPTSTGPAAERRRHAAARLEPARITHDRHRFAETEVDTRRTNLTRFPLFFPEKRTFFLQGADIFAFGLGLGESLLPYYSRRVGLVSGTEVPILAGGKVNGRVSGANLGAQIVRTREVDGLVPAATMGVVRLKQNVLAESSIGLIATAGDPRGRTGSWLLGGDVTYQTSRLKGDKNFLAGVWGVAMGRDGLGSDSNAYGATVDYPNDLWDTVARYSRVGKDFDPSLGFVARPGVHSYMFRTEFKPRPRFWNIRQMFFEYENSLVTDLENRWESYRVFTAPVNWRFESGDRAEFNWVPTGERLAAPFAIVPGVAIAPGRTTGRAGGWRPAPRRSAGSARRSRGGSAASTTGRCTS